MSTGGFKERVVTVPLRGAQAVPARGHASHLTALIREHLAEHFKVDTGNVRLDTRINEGIRMHGWQSPPSKFHVRAVCSDGDSESVVEAEPAE